jgi:hypothetical protein
MPNQNIDLAAFLGNNPYYANAVPQMTAQTAAPVAQTTVPNFDNYELLSHLTDGQINAMGYGEPIDTPSTRGLDQERFRAAPVQNVDLAAFWVTTLRTTKLPLSYSNRQKTCIYRLPLPHLM